MESRMECAVEGIIETQHVEALEILLQGDLGFSLQAVSLFNTHLPQRDLHMTKGPRQPDGKQCGIYAMRFMRDIMSDPSPLPLKLKNLSHKKGFIDKEINEVRMDFVMFIQECIMNYPQDEDEL
ncbi:hypothetical protein IFM89_018877 [Coptis chinensis]|uniref:Ubiquitin-like protease family profile domain-containing protein n=1 Tax=Coptis chinensis TaxID=261450 RepID=A0A835LS25_9MAGN|nr:hypothetical protein IFM89_018877 [Coptis chinensis]